MSKLSNCLNMITILKAKGIVKSKELAEKLEVKERMVRDYVKHIELAGIPIGSKGGRYGGYFLERDRFLPDLSFQDKELDAIKAAYEVINNMDSFHNKINFEMAYNRIASIENKLREQEKEIVYIKRSRPAPKLTKEGSKLLMVKGALISRNKVMILYQNSNGEIKERIIRPYVLVNYEDMWYCRAYCELANGMRTFKLSRIKGLNILDENYDITDSFSIDNSRLGICDDEHNIQLIINPPLANTIPEKIWGENQKISNRNDGSIFFEATMKGKDSILKWILGMGSKAEVISPQYIKDSIIEEIAKLMKKYKQN